MAAAIIFRSQASIQASRMAAFPSMSIARQVGARDQPRELQEERRGTGGDSRQFEHVSEPSHVQLLRAQASTQARKAASRQSMSMARHSALRRPIIGLQGSRLSPTSTFLDVGFTATTARRLARSYWWSSSKTAPAATDAPPTSPPSPAQIQTDPAPTHSESVLSPSLVSESTTSTASAVPAPPLASAPVDAPASVTLPDTSIADILNWNWTTDAIPALQFGDITSLGLASWWGPIYWVQGAFEAIQVTLNLPPYLTIFLLAILGRVVVFPLTIGALRNSAILLKLQPRTAEIQREMKAAKERGDTRALQVSMLKQRAIFKDAGVNLFGSITPILVQGTVAFSSFFAVRRILEAGLPQMTVGGPWVWRDLTAADPTGWGLPILSAVIMNLSMRAGRADIDMAANASTAHMMNFFRLFTLLTPVVFHNFATGTLEYIICASLVAAVQSALLRHPRFRQALNIAPRPVRTLPFPSIMESIRVALHAVRGQYSSAQAEAAGRAGGLSRAPTPLKFGVPISKGGVVRGGGAARKH